MLLARISGGTAVAVGVLGIPALHLAAVDLEGRQEAAAYLAHVDDHYLSTALAGGVTLLLAVALWCTWRPCGFSPHVDLFSQMPPRQ